MSWLWGPSNGWQWLGAVIMQTIIGFGLIAAFLTPAWGKLKRWADPTTPGGAGSKVVAGREVYLILADFRTSKGITPDSAPNSSAASSAAAASSGMRRAP